MSQGVSIIWNPTSLLGYCFLDSRFKKSAFGNETTTEVIQDATIGELPVHLRMTQVQDQTDRALTVTTTPSATTSQGTQDEGLDRTFRNKTTAGQQS